MLAKHAYLITEPPFTLLLAQIYDKKLSFLTKFFLIFYIRDSQPMGFDPKGHRVADSGGTSMLPSRKKKIITLKMVIETHCDLGSLQECIF